MEKKLVFIVKRTNLINKGRIRYDFYDFPTLSIFIGIVIDSYQLELGAFPVALFTINKGSYDQLGDLIYSNGFNTNNLKDILYLLKVEFPELQLLWHLDEQ